MPCAITEPHKRHKYTESARRKDHFSQPFLACNLQQNRFCGIGPRLMMIIIYALSRWTRLATTAAAAAAPFLISTLHAEFITMIALHNH